MYQNIITVYFLLSIYPSVIVFIKKSLNNQAAGFGFDKSSLLFTCILVTTFTNISYKAGHICINDTLMSHFSTKILGIFFLLLISQISRLNKSKSVKTLLVILSLATTCMLFLSSNILIIFILLECSSLIFFVILATGNNSKLTESGTYAFISVSFLFSCAFFLAVVLMVLFTTCQNLEFILNFENAVNIKPTAFLMNLLMSVKAGLIPALLYKLDVYRAMSFHNLSFYIIMFFWVYTCLIVYLTKSTNVGLGLTVAAVSASIALVLNSKFFYFKELLAMSSSFILLLAVISM